MNKPEIRTKILSEMINAIETWSSLAAVNFNNYGSISEPFVEQFDKIEFVESELMKIYESLGM